MAAKFRKPNNYAELMRKTRDYHVYSFPLPRGYATKADLEKARNSQPIQSYIKYNNPTVEQITKQIRRIATDAAIDRKLSPQQKTSISKTWLGNKTGTQEGLQKYIEQTDKKDFAFVKSKNANRKARYKNHTSTKKGVFIQVDNQTAKEVGKGRNARIELKDIYHEPQYIGRGKKRREIPEIKKELFTFPTGINIQDYVTKLVKKYSPKSIVMFLKGYSSNTSYDSIDFLGYVFEYITNQQNAGKGHPYSGVLLSWY